MYEVNIINVVLNFLNSSALYHQEQESQVQVLVPCW